MLDNKGHFVLDLKYDNVWPIDKNNFTVTQNGNKGIVNKNGKVIVPIRYTYVRVEQGRIYASDGDYNTRETYDLQLLFQD